MVRTSLVVFAVVLSSTTGPHAAFQPAGALPFEPVGAPLVVLPVRVNGNGPYPFLVDTGSSHTSIDASLAASLGAPRVAKTLVSSSTGNEWAAVVRLERVAVGPLTASEVLATEVPDQRLATLGPVMGVVGLDLLTGCSFTLDYARRQIVWPGEPRSDHSAVLPLKMVGGMWFVATRARHRALLLMLDSGADSVVLFGTGARDIRWRPGRTTVRSVVGPRQARQGAMAVLDLGPWRLVDLPVTGLDDPAGAAHGDGLLPLHLFERVTVYPDAGEVALALPRAGSGPAVAHVP